MSLVGTRPPTVDEWELYEPHHGKYKELTEKEYYFADFQPEMLLGLFRAEN